ncbi:MAG: FAD:protein FMN transferase [Streptomyces sp.]|nr:FAD:protein FMN transferase [Streptomyces sp.]
MPHHSSETGPAAAGTRFTFEAIGTHWTIDTARPLTDGLRCQMLARIDAYDRTWSRFRPNSLIRRIATAPHGGTYTFPDHATTLFDLYDRLGELTDGAVDPLVGRDLELLGYDAHYTLTPAAPTERAAHQRRTWASDITRHGATTLITHGPVLIDTGAAGKGHLIDLISAELTRAGHGTHLIDAGGDLRHQSPRTLRIGLEHPDDPTRVLGIARLRDKALAASATNRRAWGNGLHHVLDARTGTPTREVRATWVVTDDAATADALATALFFTTPQHLATVYEFTAVRLHADGRLAPSPDFDGELFT